MQTVFWIFIGGGVGSAIRFLISEWFAARFGETFPLGTLAVNVFGSFLIGTAAALTEADGKWLLPPLVRQCLMLGILGGFTTFSSFSLQTMNLARDGAWLYAGWNIISSVTLCLVAVWMGHATGLAFNR